MILLLPHFALVHNNVHSVVVLRLLDGTKGIAKGNSQACAQFLGQYFTPSDLATFQQTYNLPPQPISRVVGKNDPNNVGIEASLDVEYITGTIAF